MEAALNGLILLFLLLQFATISQRLCSFSVDSFEPLHSELNQHSKHADYHHQHCRGFTLFAVTVSGTSRVDPQKMLFSLQFYVRGPECLTRLVVQSHCSLHGEHLNSLSG